MKHKVTECEENMKKNLVKVLCAGLIALQLAGCGNQGAAETQTESTSENTTEEANTVTDKLYFSEIDVDNTVVLGEYKNLDVVKNVQTVTEEDVESYISYMLSMTNDLTEVTTRDVVENGDVANIDYVGMKDGVAFEGGTAQGYDLTIGSGSFIPGFEEGLIGVKKGETVDLNLTFPENYGAADMAGAEVVFTVTVNGIYEEVTPEFNDEFVANLGISGVVTTDQYRTYAKLMMQESADATSEQDLQAQVMNLVTENAQVQEIPQELITKFEEISLQNVEYQASMYGMDLESFISAYYGVEYSAFEEQMTLAATESAKQALVCIKIAKEENIVVTDEELNAIIEENYASYGYDSVDTFKNSVDMEEYTDSLLLNKVVAFLVENANVSEVEELAQ